jgi:hypothetical protein
MPFKEAQQPVQRPKRYKELKKNPVGTTNYEEKDMKIRELRK